MVSSCLVPIVKSDNPITTPISSLNQELKTLVAGAGLTHDFSTGAYMHYISIRPFFDWYISVTKNLGNFHAQ